MSVSFSQPSTLPSLSTFDMNSEVQSSVFPDPTWEDVQKERDVYIIGWNTGDRYGIWRCYWSLMRRTVHSSKGKWWHHYWKIGWYSFDPYLGALDKPRMENWSAQWTEEAYHLDGLEKVVENRFDLNDEQKVYIKEQLQATQRLEDAGHLREFTKRPVDWTWLDNPPFP